MGNNTFSLGTRLRALRNERNLSQRDLARASGISANAISLIERDENSPSVATLQNLAAALNVKMSYFFDEEAVNHSVLVFRNGGLPAITSNGTTIASLSERLKGQELEPFRVTLKPLAGSGDRLVIHSGHEFVYCLRGTIEYMIDYVRYELHSGDLLLFEAQLPHRWRNPGLEEAELLLILDTSYATSDPIQRHFIDHPSLTHIW